MTINGMKADFPQFPEISIIIPTRDRKVSLRLMLNSLLALRYPKDRYEMIVVDDGSIDGTEELVKKVQGEMGTNLHFYRQERKGISAAKNLGIEKSRGDILVFTDDDCLVEPDWLVNLIEPFRSPGVGAVGGPDRIPLNGPFIAKCVDYTITSFFGTGGVREGKTVRLANYYPRGCNTALLRSVVEKTGGFDETLVPGEDIELIYRIKKAGFGIRYAPDAFIWHWRRDSVPGFLSQIYSRGFGRAELGQRHIGLLEWPYLLPSSMVLGFMGLITLSFWVPLAFKVSLALAALYLLLSLSAGARGAVRIGAVRAFFLIPCLMMLQHVSYGVGFLIGLFRRRHHD